jgi:hypothetical protein
MNFLTRLAVAALALALVAIAPARATTYTTQYSVTNGAYVSLGNGPLQVSLNAGPGVYLIVSDTQPSVGALGELLDLLAWSASPRVFNVSSQVWALAAQPGGATLQVTNGLAGGPAAPLSVAVNNNPPGSGGFATSQASIGATASPIATARTGVAGTGRISVTLYNAGSATVYFGPSGVTTATGMPLIAGAAVTISTQAAIYGIAASGTQILGVMETF